MQDKKLISVENAVSPEFLVKVQQRFITHLTAIR